jgi:hypothetical protein
MLNKLKISDEQKNSEKPFTSCLRLDQLIRIRENDLPPNEHVKIKQHLAYCELCQDAIDGLVNLADSFQIKKNVFILNNSIHHRLKNASSTPINFIKNYAAAALLIVSLISTFYLLSRQPAHEKLFSEYFAPFPNTIPLVRGDEASIPIEPAMTQYELGNFKSAAALLASLSVLQPDNLIARFYLGICFLTTEHIDQAIEQFDFVLKAENFHFTPQVEWYAALAHLKNNNLKTAKQILNRIVKKRKFESDRSRDLLNKINSLQ